MRRLLVLSLLAACVSSDSHLCKDGVTTCGPDAKCDEIHGGCILPAQERACEGLAQLAPCTVNEIRGICREGVCLAEECGDTVVTGSEDCDGTDLKGATCETLGFYEPGALTCSPVSCTYQLASCKQDGTWCGDRDINGPELCDGSAPAATCVDLGGYDIGVVGCSPGCGPDFGGCQRFGLVQMTTDLMAATAVINYQGVWAHAPDNVFAVGTFGTILHYDGVVWRAVRDPMPTARHLRSVFGTSASNIYAVGDGGTILRYDGTAWSAMQANTTVDLRDVWASGPSDVWAVGQGSQVGHYNGTSWSFSTVVTEVGQSAGPPWNGIWGFGPNDIFIVGKGVTPSNLGAIRRYNGTTWTPMASGTGYELTDVFGTSPNAVFATGTEGRFGMYNGSSWSIQATDFGAGNLLSVWGTGPSNMFAAGDGGLVVHYDGTRYQLFGTAQHTVNSLWGTSAQNVVAVGNFGTLESTTGTSFVPTALGTTLTSAFNSIWAVDNTTMYVAGNEQVFTITSPATSSPFPTEQTVNGAPLGTQFTSVFGTSASTVYVAATETSSTGRIYQRTAANTFDPFPGSPTTPMTGVWATGNQVFAVATAPKQGGGTEGWVHRYTGSAWESQKFAGVSELVGVWGSSANNVFAVGTEVKAGVDTAAIVHWNGSIWQQVPLAVALRALNAITGTGPSDIWVVGDFGMVAHWNGTSFAQDLTFPDKTESLNAVVVTSSGAVLVGGNVSNLQLRQGGSWVPLGTGSLDQIRGIAPLGKGVRLVGRGRDAIDVVATSVTCSGAEDACTNYLDDDCDGMADACDADCGRGTPGYKGPPEQCANGRDDDCDGDRDCMDSDCKTLSACLLPTPAP